MKLNPNFEDAFLARASRHGECAASFGDCWQLIKLQGLNYYLQLCWEAFTLVFIFLPATDIIKTLVRSVSDKWDCLSNLTRTRVLNVLYFLDAKGDITSTILPGSKIVQSRRASAMFYMFWGMSYALVVILILVVLFTLLFLVEQIHFVERFAK